MSATKNKLPTQTLPIPKDRRVAFIRYLRNRATSAPRTIGAALPQLVRS